MYANVWYARQKGPMCYSRALQHRIPKVPDFEKAPLHLVIARSPTRSASDLEYVHADATAEDVDLFNKQTRLMVTNIAAASTLFDSLAGSAQVCANYRRGVTCCFAHSESIPAV